MAKDLLGKGRFELKEQTLTTITGIPAVLWYDSKVQVYRLVPRGYTFDWYYEVICLFCSGETVCQECGGDGVGYDDSGAGWGPCSACKATGRCWECDDVGLMPVPTEVNRG